MSLDVYLELEEPIERTAGTGVFVRDDGKTRELTLAEVQEKWPDASVNEQGNYTTTSVYENNITHNLGKMADKAGIYYALWRPEEKGWQYARDIAPVLEKGLADLKATPHYFKQFNPENGWGSYEGLVRFVEDYLAACREYPNAKVEVSR